MLLQMALVDRIEVLPAVNFLKELIKDLFLVDFHLDKILGRL